MKIKKLDPVGISWLVTTVLLLMATWYNVVVKDELGIVGIVFFSSMVAFPIAHLVLRRGK